MVALLCLVHLSLDADPAAMTERYGEAEAFAEAHHPELAKLLTTLKTSPAAYRSAVNELLRQRDRLERLRDRDHDRYQLALDQWKLASRTKLAAARAAAAAAQLAGDADNPRLKRADAAAKEELERLLTLKFEQERKAVASEIEELEKRVERLRARQSRLTNSFDSVVATEANRLVRSATAVQRRRNREQKTQPSE